MSEKVLITPAELSDMVKSEPIVVIDTRDPATYAAGHLPNAVNIHDIFTYLATSTPEGVAALRDKFAGIFGAAGLSGDRDRGRLRAVDEHGIWSVLPRLRPAALPRLPEGQNPARRLCRLDRRRPAHVNGGADARAQELPDRSERRRHPGRSAKHEGRGRRPQYRQARHPRRRRVDRRFAPRPTARISARARDASRARSGSNGTG